MVPESHRPPRELGMPSAFNPFTMSCWEYPLAYMLKIRSTTADPSGCGIKRIYEMYSKKYQEMAAAYPQVLIAQRTLMQLEVSYITAPCYLLTDGLESPSQPGGIDRPVREVNIPFQAGASPQ